MTLENSFIVSKSRRACSPTSSAIIAVPYPHPNRAISPMMSSTASKLHHWPGIEPRGFPGSRTSTHTPSRQLASQHKASSGDGDPPAIVRRAVGNPRPHSKSCLGEREEAEGRTAQHVLPGPRESRRAEDAACPEAAPRGCCSRGGRQDERRRP